MARIIPFDRHIDSFDPETAKAMAQAFDAAWKELSQSGRVEAEPFRARRTRDVMARRILEIATMGERDPGRLREAALAAAQTPRIVSADA